MSHKPPSGACGCCEAGLLRPTLNPTYPTPLAGNPVCEAERGFTMAQQKERTLRHPSWWFMALAPALWLSPPAHAADTYALIATYFLSVDSLLQSISRDQHVRSSNLTVGEKALLKAMGKHPAFEYLIRTNSKGKIVNKVESGKIAERTYRYVGSQTWFKVVALTAKPYYGTVTSRKSGLCLFWNRPTLVGSRFTGALAAKIGLKECFADIAEQNSIRFGVRQGKKTIFSNLAPSDRAGLTTAKLAIHGMSGLSVDYPVTAARRMPPSAEVTDAPAAVAQAKVSTKEKSESREKPKSGVAVKADKKLSKKAKAEADKPAGGSNEGVIFLIVIIIAVAGAASAFIVGLIIAGQKRRRLERAIDKGEA